MDRSSLAALEGLLGPSVGLVTVTHVPTHSGAVAPVHEVGALARRAGVPFFLDACQSVGQLPVDLGEIGCDVATMTGRKWLGAREGPGCSSPGPTSSTVSTRRGSTRPPRHGAPDGNDYTLADGARRFEEFEGKCRGATRARSSHRGPTGAGRGSGARTHRQLAALLRTMIDRAPGLHSTDEGSELSGIVTFSVEGCEADRVAAAASAAGINVSVSRAENSRIEFDRRGLDAVVRASPHAYNTDELDRLVEVLVDV